MASSSDSLFSHTLLGITTTKLEQLAKKHDTFEAPYVKTIAQVGNEQNDLDKVKLISEGLKVSFGVSLSGGKVVRGSTKSPHVEIDVQNFDRFLAQARYDPSISTNAVRQWQDILMRHLEVQSLKFLYADLYGRLTTEWLSSKQRVVPGASKGRVDTDSFEHVSGTKRIDSRLMWERSAFKAADVSSDGILSMLHGTFERTNDGSKHLQEALTTLRKHVSSHESSLATLTNFTPETLKWTITGLVSSDLLTEEKRTVLRGFLENSVILSEIADVLNMRMAVLDEWSWGEVVQLEERRQLNGSYNIYMHEDLLQAIFLQYVGIKWSVAWKRAFTAFRKSKAVWKSSHTSATAKDRKRREYFLGTKPYNSSVLSKELWLYRRQYFVYQLYDREEQSFATDQGDEEANFEDMVMQNIPSRGGRAMQTARQQLSAQAPRRQMASMDARQSDIFGAHMRRNLYEAGVDNEDDDDDPDDPKSPMQAKQGLLHLFSTKILMNTRLHGEITCFRSQVEALYPSLPHVTILTVLEYLGVSTKWMSFFKRFLEAPLQFIDDQSSASRKRMRGTPGSHVLSEVFSEVVLFCLDFEINSVTNGNLLWRMGDDFWFSSPDYGSCVTAWRAITNFMETTGLSLNERRSGSARIVQMEGGTDQLHSVDVGPSLPPGQIRWGMLYLNPESGCFEIDREMVDKHIDEMSRQLEEKKDSIFAWIQGWNSYAITFFTTNFGKPASCFGRQHIDSMLEINSYIQRKIFSSSADATSVSGSVVEFLRQSIEQRFAVKDIPDGYFFFPSELGGLDIRNPFVRLIQIREATEQRPGKAIDDFLQGEKEAYQQAKARFESGETHKVHWGMADPHFTPDDAETFFSFEEFVRFREVFNYELGEVFQDLLSPPEEQSLEYDSHGIVNKALSALGGQQNLRGITNDWLSMEPYWRWVAQLYGPEMIQRFGGFRIVDPGLLPTGMVSLLRNARLDWEE